MACSRLNFNVYGCNVNSWKVFSFKYESCSFTHLLRSTEKEENHFRNKFGQKLWRRGDIISQCMYIRICALFQQYIENEFVLIFLLFSEHYQDGLSLKTTTI